MQQAVIHVRQTKAQVKLYRAFKKYQQNSSNNNFLEQYNKLFPVNNHPGALLFRRSSASNRVTKLQGGASKESPEPDKDMPAKNTQTRTPIAEEHHAPAAENTKSEIKVKVLSSPIAQAMPIGENDVSFENSQESVEVVVIIDSDDEDDIQGEVSNLDDQSPEKTTAETHTSVVPVDGKPSFDQDDEVFQADSKEEKTEWWEPVLKKLPNLDAIQNGGKAMLLLQILAHSEMIGRFIGCYIMFSSVLDSPEKPI